ncbi:Protein CHROMATIN REMODELING 4 [Frankliniella fusca]|uniref:Protein CHROMATIN REMODELING 4 n=1 Tax=Frankliniella fusca TaxID=407009 RepID=A0AAE1I1Q7_9NEOP|nr:Protein CHROMATIN REMODELING 4 [Frankliniella fusca]
MGTLLSCPRGPPSTAPNTGKKIRKNHPYVGVLFFFVDPERFVRLGWLRYQSKEESKLRRPYEFQNSDTWKDTFAPAKVSKIDSVLREEWKKKMKGVDLVVATLGTFQQHFGPPLLQISSF